MSHIVTIPDPVLNAVAIPVINFDKKLLRILEDMKNTLIHTTNPKGVGLAAPQVGLSLQIFITRPREKDAIRVFINPVIESMTEGDAESKSKLEGCLSIPKIWGHVRRAPQLTLTFQDETGTKHTEDFKGFFATIIQHETDHLNGRLFTSRVLEQKGKFYQTVYDKDGKEELEEIELK